MDYDPNDHHLILGELEDILTGRILPDTHDERYRQKICEMLLNTKGFAKEDIQGRFIHELKAGKQTAQVKIDFLIHHKTSAVCLIKYAPGSLVTRRLSTLALSRTLVPYQIPIIAVTNGEDAEVIDGDTGNVMSQGLTTIPTLESIKVKYKSFSFKPISPGVFNQASRIAFACEVDGACPCDTDICILEGE